MHPTKFTDEKGDVKDVSAKDLGVQSIKARPQKSIYLMRYFMTQNLRKKISLRRSQK